MSHKTAGMAVGLVSFLCLVTTAKESQPQGLTTLDDFQRIAQLQREVVRAPDDVKAYRALLEAGLALFKRPGYSIPDDMRESVLKLKLVMEDMFSLRDTIEDMGPPWPAVLGTDTAQLVNRLKSRRVPPAYRRSVPSMDPWGTRYRLFVNADTGTYKIVCAGSDRRFEAANLGITAQDRDQVVGRQPVQRSSTLKDDIVFISGKNFTRIFDYPEDAQTFLYIRCQPADELEPERVRCW